LEMSVSFVCEEVALLSREEDLQTA
jgi:hypothetical protein